MENTIYTVQVEITSQEQADKLKRLCIENDLEAEPEQFITCCRFDNELKETFRFFRYSNQHDAFAIWQSSIHCDTITEQEFINLLN